MKNIIPLPNDENTIEDVLACLRVDMFVDVSSVENRKLAFTVGCIYSCWTSPHFKQYTYAQYPTRGKHQLETRRQNLFEESTTEDVLTH
jgi:hypothetical protein